MKKNSTHFNHLLEKYLDNKCNPAEIQELFSLINSSSENRELLESMKNDFENLFHTQQESTTPIEKNEVPVIPMKSHTNRWVKMAIVAASLILLTGIGWIFFQNSSTPQSSQQVSVSISDSIKPGSQIATLTLSNQQTILLNADVNDTIAQQGNAFILKNQNDQLIYQPNNDPSAVNIYNTLSTPRGGQYSITLPDGTNVWLNAFTSLRFPVAFSNERHVFVDGEAYFEVAKNAKKPFIVELRNGEKIEVLGTHFNIMNYEDEENQKITLVEGSVKVLNKINEVILKPGEQALSKNNGKINVNKNINVDHEIAWKNGLFDFENEKLTDIMRQISRWYNVDIIYPSSIPDGHYSGAIRRESNIQDVLKMLSLAGNVNFSTTKNQILVNQK